MRLTQHTDYAMRVLIYAATLWGDGRLASIREIADAYAISENHLMKVVHRLSQLGLLQTQRGRNGGLRLAREPGAMRLGRLIQAVEDDLDLVQCFSGASDCPLVGLCGLASALDDARQQFLIALDRYTLADVLPRTAGKAGAEQVVAWRNVLPARA
ncbi:MAG TPA: Rrf2 family transcriptional regulator [Ramlibacter sp.]|nr:Rrf2 family transcriptional regulator [Ramlibacter sp.]